MRLRSATLFTLLALAACNPVPEKGVRVSGTTSASIAVGARYRFAVIDECSYSGPGFILIAAVVPLIIPTPPACLHTKVSRIVRHTMSTPGVFSVTATNVDKGAALFEIRALAPGTTRFQITIATDSGLEYDATATFTAEAVARVALAGNCVSWSDGSDELVPAGRQVGFRPTLYGQSSRALAGFGVSPFTLTGGGTLESDPATRQLLFTPPTSTGEVVITSPIDSAFRKTLTIIDTSSFTALEIDARTPAIETADGDDLLQARALVGTRHSCFDSFPRRVWTDTPAACGLHSSNGTPAPTTIGTEVTSADGRFIYARGLQLGATCSVHAELTGTLLTTRLDLLVREGWTKHPLPTDGFYTGGLSTGPGTILLIGGRNTGTGSAQVTTASVTSWDGTTFTPSTVDVPANAEGKGRLDAIWGDGAGTLFAVGSFGSIVTRTGSGPWTLMTTGTNADLRAVHGRSATDVWAVGARGTVLHFTAGSWQNIPTTTTGVLATTTLRGVYAAAADDVTIVGEQQTVVHTDGMTWTAIDLAPVLAPTITRPQQYTAVFGTGPDDVYVGSVEATLRWDGMAWKLAQAKRGTAIWATAPDDVWTAGEYGEYQHWDGNTWTSIRQAQALTSAVWGRGREEIYGLSVSRELSRYR